MSGPGDDTGGDESGAGSDDATQRLPSQPGCSRRRHPASVRSASRARCRFLADRPRCGPEAQQIGGVHVRPRSPAAPDPSVDSADDRGLHRVRDFAACLYPPQNATVTNAGTFIKGSDGQEYFVPSATKVSTPTTTTTTSTTTPDRVPPTTTATTVPRSSTTTTYPHSQTTTTGHADHHHDYGWIVRHHHDHGAARDEFDHRPRATGPSASTHDHGRRTGARRSTSDPYPQPLALPGAVVSSGEPGAAVVVLALPDVAAGVPVMPEVPMVHRGDRAFGEAPDEVGKVVDAGRPSRFVDGRRTGDVKAWVSWS